MLIYRVLLTEGESALSKEMKAELDKNNFSIQVLPADLLDAKSASLTDFWNGFKPNFVIDTAFLFGSEGAGNKATYRTLAKLAKKSGSFWIHLSSSAVFSSTPTGQRLAETEKPVERNPNARALIKAESRVAGYPKHIILRLPWLIGGQDNNLLTLICDRLRLGKEVDVSASAYGTPVSYEEVIRVVIAIMHQLFCGCESWGIYHMCSSEPCSEAEFADGVSRLLVAENIGVSDMNAVTAADAFSLPWAGSLSGDRLTFNFGIQQRSWRQGLKRCVQEWIALNVSRESQKPLA